MPLADAAVESTVIRVAHAASTIRSAPGIGAEPRIDQSEERRLYAHYGLGYSEDDSGSGLPSDDPPPEAPPETREQAARAPPTAWGAPDAEQTVAPDTTANGQEPHDLVERRRAHGHQPRTAAGGAAVAGRARDGRHPRAPGRDRPRVRRSAAARRPVRHAGARRDRAR